MARYEVSKHQADKLHQMVVRQDQNARALGAMVAGYELARKELRESFNGSSEGYALRVGALVVEYEVRREFFLNTIHRDEDHQRELGELALRSVGIDPDSGNYSINNGVVLKLVNGVWLEEFQA